MMKWTGRLIAAVLVAAVVFAAVETVAAQGPRDRWPGLRDRDARVLGAVRDAFAEATGLTWQDIVPELQSGKTLSDVLTDKGLDPAAVSAQVKTTLETEIAQAVLDGKITQAQADLLTAGIDRALERIMTETLPIADRLWERVHQNLENSLIGVMAEMAGEEPGDLLRDALTPPTLAEIASGMGLDPDAIVTETAARITEEVNQRVADGTLTEEAAAQLLDGLAERLTERMDTPLGRLWGGRGIGEGMFGGRGPMRGGWMDRRGWMM